MPLALSPKDVSETVVAIWPYLGPLVAGVVGFVAAEWKDRRSHGRALALERERLQAAEEVKRREFLVDLYERPLIQLQRCVSAVGPDPYGEDDLPAGYALSLPDDIERIRIHGDEDIYRVFHELWRKVNARLCCFGKHDIEGELDAETYTALEEFTARVRQKIGAIRSTPLMATPASAKRR